MQFTSPNGCKLHPLGTPVPAVCVSNGDHRGEAIYRMSMFERAAGAWKTQEAEERTARTERDRKLCEQFSGLLQKITGTSDFMVRGSGEQMSAEIEGVVFVPDMRFYGLIGSMWGVWIVTDRADGWRKMSGLICTTGDLGRELERLMNDRNTWPERDVELRENEGDDSIEHLLKLIG